MAGWEVVEGRGGREESAGAGGLQVLEELGEQEELEGLGGWRVSRGWRG